MYNLTVSKTKSLQQLKVIFVDFFEHLALKRYSERKTYGLWAKFMIRELGMDLEINQLTVLRKNYEDLLFGNDGRDRSKFLNQNNIDEFHSQLIATNIIQEISKIEFSNCFKNADIRAKILTYASNISLLELLGKLRKKGIKLYCFSDTESSLGFIREYLNKNELEHFFEDILVWPEKETGTIKNQSLEDILKLKDLKFQEVAIITNNVELKNDLGIKSISLDVDISKAKNTLPDFKLYRKIVNELYRTCNRKSAPPHSDYILFYYTYIERLYKKAKKDKIKNICFLAREGLFLKKLFDYYQNKVSIDKDNSIKTHYFKASRNSLMLVSFKDIKEEEFEYLKRRWPNLSVNSFLKNFNFSEETIDAIIKDSGLDHIREDIIVNFLESETFSILKSSEEFVKSYNETRNNQKHYFEVYLRSFDLNIQAEGIHLADVGWGGTMQNRLYDYFEQQVQVHGYYLGVREIHKIKKNNKKFGLNFSVYPSINFFDYILMANVELNEQLLAAGHGSTIAYTTEENGFTIEYFEENDKRVYNNYIARTQEFMFELFKELTGKFNEVCYDFDLQHYVMVDYALKIGLFANKRKVRREVNIYKGFYQNVGSFSVGLAFGENLGKSQKIKLVKDFFLYPEKAFRYVLRLKPLLLRQNVYFLSCLLPIHLIYYHIKLRMYFKGLRPKKVNMV